MKIDCVWEHNGNDTLLYAASLPGAYARGGSREEALSKMAGEVRSYLLWRDGAAPEGIELRITQEAPSTLLIRDADSDVLFDAEREPLTAQEYGALKALALKSAGDFQRLYNAIPQKDLSHAPARRTFYGSVPRTAQEMYEHTKSVNSYYFAELDVEADNEGTIAQCRSRGFAALEAKPSFLANALFEGSYGESWNLRKVLRRFLWHDRIHARAMYRMALRTFGSAPDVFCFEPERRSL